MRTTLLQKFLLLPAFISVDSFCVVFWHISNLLWSEWLLLFLQIPSKTEARWKHLYMFSSPVFKACCKIKHPNWWKLKITFLRRSLSGRKTKRKQEFLIQIDTHLGSWPPETTSVQGAQEATAPPPVCSAFRLPLVLSHLLPPKLTARGADLAGSQISVLRTWTVGLAFPQTLGCSLFPCPHTVPTHGKLLPVPKAWGWRAVMGRRSWERSAMPPQKQPLGVQWSRRRFHFNCSDSL